jgi:hypothetical protein
MSWNEVSAEKLAEIFHHYHQALHLDFGATGEVNRGPGPEVAQPERSRMVAAARLARLELDPPQSRDERASRYFARAGQAERGCSRVKRRN